MSWRLPLLLSLPLLTCGCSSNAPSNIPEGATIVLEGLPHPSYASKLFESEKAAKETKELHGSYFYEKFHPAKDTETNELRELLMDPERFEPFEGEKKCGGFHADYAVAWKLDGQVYEVLICFGCGEVKRFGPAGEVREDIKQETSHLLKLILKSYDELRPAGDKRMWE